MTTTKSTNGLYEKVATNERDTEAQPSSRYGYGHRHLQSLLFFSCLCVTIVARAHISVTIVAMTKIPNFLEDIHFDSNDTDGNVRNTDDGNFTNADGNFTNIYRNFINTNENFTNADGNFTNIDKYYASSKYRNTQDVYVTLNDTVVKNTSVDEDVIIASNATNVNNTDIDNIDEHSNGTVTESLVQSHENVSSTNKINAKSSSHTKFNIFRKYEWSKPIQEMILGSFFLGYMIMMSPMGVVAQRFGGKLPLQISLTISGIVTLATPWLAAWGGWKAVSASRVVLGLSQAGTYPSINTLLARWVPQSERGRLASWVYTEYVHHLHHINMLLARWVPQSERGRLASWVYTGANFGAVLAFQVGGFLAASSIGWPLTFWATGGLCLTMAVLLTAFGAATPLEHSAISDEERNFILGYEKQKTALGAVEVNPATPWKAILSSKPVWGGFAAHIGTSSIYLFLFSQIPTYLRYVLKVDIKSNGVYTSMPYLANFVTTIFLGLLSDYLTNNKILTLEQARKLSSTCASMLPALCLTALSFATTTHAAVALMVLALATLSGTHTGWMVNYIDLSPRFAGTLMATGNTITNFAALLIPVFVSQVVLDVSNPLQWRIVMFSVAAFSVACGVIYACLMSAKKQPWDDPQEIDADATGRKWMK